VRRQREQRARFVAGEDDAAGAVVAQHQVADRARQHFVAAGAEPLQAHPHFVGSHRTYAERGDVEDHRQDDQRCGGQRDARVVLRGRLQPGEGEERRRRGESGGKQQRDVEGEGGNERHQRIKRQPRRIQTGDAVIEHRREPENGDDHQDLRLAQSAGAAQQKAGGKRRLQEDEGEHVPGPRHTAKGQEQWACEQCQAGDGEMHEEKAFVTRALEIVGGRFRVHERTDADSKTREHRHANSPGAASRALAEGSLAARP
jgi:hypothetical protein